MKTKLFAFVSVVLTLSLCAACALGATANATIIAPHPVAVTAPHAGTLVPFDLETGEKVVSSAILFEIETTPVYAPMDGVVSAMFAFLGDDASGVVSHYGAVAAIEPKYPLYIDADTGNAHDNDDNHYLHAGETLYLKCGSEKGTGVVTSVHGEDYIVEIRSGSFDLDDTVQCYRESAMPYDSKTGDGKVKRFDDIPVSASGRVYAVHAAAGQAVSAGDLLFETIDPQGEPGAEPEVRAPITGAVSAMYVQSGAQVYRGQLLCEIINLDNLELSAEIDELDLNGVREGDTLSYTLDAYGAEVFTGTVTEIRPIGTARQNATYFDVRITLPQGKTLLPGMNATVTIGQ